MEADRSSVVAMFTFATCGLIALRNGSRSFDELAHEAIPTFPSQASGGPTKTWPLTNRRNT